MFCWNFLKSNIRFKFLFQTLFMGFIWLVFAKGGYISAATRPSLDDHTVTPVSLACLVYLLWHLNKQLLITSCALEDNPINDSLHTDSHFPTLKEKFNVVLYWEVFSSRNGYKPELRCLQSYSISSLVSLPFKHTIKWKWKKYVILDCFSTSDLLMLVKY